MLGLLLLKHIYGLSDEDGGACPVPWLLGETAKQQERRLRQKIDRRGLRVPAIHWA